MHPDSTITAHADDGAPARPAGRAGAADRHRRPGRQRQDRAGRRAVPGPGAASCRIGVVTNDIYTTEDADFLRRAGVLPDDRIRAVQTGACPHTAIRDDISANLDAVEAARGRLSRPRPDPGRERRRQPDRDVLLRAGRTAQIFVIDVAGGDKVPRKGGPGVTRSDLLVINKTDLAPLVGADLDGHGARRRGGRAATGSRCSRRWRPTRRPRTWPPGCARCGPRSRVRDRPHDGGRRAGWRARHAVLPAAADAAAGARRRPRPVRAAPGRDRGGPAGRRRPLAHAAAAARGPGHAARHRGQPGPGPGRPRGGDAVDPGRAGRLRLARRRPGCAGRLRRQPGGRAARAGPGRRSGGAVAGAGRAGPHRGTARAGHAAAGT